MSRYLIMRPWITCVCIHVCLRVNKLDQIEVTLSTPTWMGGSALVWISDGGGAQQSVHLPVSQQTLSRLKRDMHVET